tara:strand:- start:1291 stop:1470 length:180 start_codon:yes stop_codon:yes gene_type:complete
MDYFTGTFSSFAFVGFAGIYLQEFTFKCYLSLFEVGCRFQGKKEYFSGLDQMLVVGQCT